MFAPQIPHIKVSSIIMWPWPLQFLTGYQIDFVKLLNELKIGSFEVKYK
jgi:hypothetical protein